MKNLQSTLTLIAAACAMATAQAQRFTASEDAADAKELLFAMAPTGSTSTSTPNQRMGPWGFDLSGRDLTVKPGDDFFKWANGAWEARTQIPADRTRYGTLMRCARSRMTVCARF